MFSKFSILWVLSLTLVGCGLPLGEKPPEPTPPVNTFSTKTACLKDVLPTMSDFVSGKAQIESVTSAWDCFDSAIDVFASSTRGKNSDSYTGRELANFFEQLYFSEDVRINDKLLSGIMGIKVLIVGGSRSELTKIELSKLQEFARLMKRLSIQLHPYMKLYSQNWRPDQLALEDNEKYFEAGGLNLQLALAEIAAVIEKNESSYQINEFVDFLSEVQSLYKAKWGFVNSLDQGMPAVYQLKSMLVGGESQVILSSEWRSFAQFASRGYFQFLRMVYFVEPMDNLLNERGMGLLMKSITEICQFVSEMVARQPDQQVDIGELYLLSQSFSKLLPKLHFSKELISEVMVLKKMILGGSEESISVQDFAYLQQQLPVYMKLVMDYRKISGFVLGKYQFSASTELAANEFSEQESALKGLAEVATAQLKSGYDLRRLVSLAQELDRHFSKNDSWKKIAVTVLEYYGVYASVLAEDSQAISWNLSVQDIKSLVQVAAEGASRFAYYYYLVKPFEDKPESRVQYYSSIRNLVLDSERLFQLVLGQTQQGRVSVFRLKQAEQKFKIFDYFGLDKLPAEKREQLLGLLLSRVLVRPSDRLSGYAPRYLDMKGIVYAKEELVLWLNGQIWLASVLGESTRISNEKLLSALGRLPDGYSKRELILAFQSSSTMVLDEQGRILIDYENRPYDWASLSQMNLIRMSARILLSSYATDISRTQGNTGLNLIEIKTVIEHVMPLLNSLGILPAKPEKFADDRFRDANLFMPRSNGDEWLSFQEGVDLLQSLLSGLKADRIYKAGLLSRCPAVVTEIPPKQVYKLDCFLNDMAGNWADAISHMRFYVDFLKRMPNSDRKGFIFNQAKSAGYVPNDSKTINSSDIGLVPQIAQYVEWMVKKYDSNRDGRLTKQEAMPAYPVFKSILAKASGQTSESRLRGLFAYLLKNGKAPETLSEKADYMYWTYVVGESGWEFEVNRQKFAGILGYIADVIEKAESGKTSGSSDDVIFSVSE